MQNKLFENSKVAIIAGPCAIESAQQINEVCKNLNSLGLNWVRGGACKPRVNPHSFQGLGEKGYKYLSQSAKKFHLKTVSEVVDSNSIKWAKKYSIDVFQIGSRNMTNYSLLKEIGKGTCKTKTPILFKRGMSSTISEWLQASEYISTNGNKNIMMCERGIRTFEDSTRFTLDVAAVPIIHKQSKYPICVDVSHAAGNSYLVESLSCAAIASGCDALMIEVHPCPNRAKCDGPQQLNFKSFEKLLPKLEAIAKSVGKEIC